VLPPEIAALDPKEQYVAAAMYAEAQRDENGKPYIVSRKVSGGYSYAVASVVAHSGIAVSGRAAVNVDAVASDLAGVSIDF
jgi:hypothetical protein